MGGRYLVDTTKAAASAAFPSVNVIVDQSRKPFEGEASVGRRPVIALCPITETNAPICEGAFSFAPVVQRALECHDDLVAALSLVEWAGVTDREEGGIEPSCAYCDAPKSGGKHFDSCKLAAALTKAGAQ